MPFRPLTVDAYLTLATSNWAFECELRALTVNPSPEWINTLCPAGTWPDVEWTLDLSYLPGTSDVEGSITLDAFLFDHYGEQMTFSAWPYGQGQPGYAGLCSIAPGPIGGTQSEWPELGVSLPIYGQPDQIAVEAAGAEVATMMARSARRRVLAQRATNPAMTGQRLRW